MWYEVERTRGLNRTLADANRARFPGSEAMPAQWDPWTSSSGVSDPRTAGQAQRLAQKADPIEIVIAGLCHDFSNLLTVINGYCSLLLSDENLSPAARTRAERIRAAGDEAVCLTRQMVNLGRNRTAAIQVFDLNRLIAETEPLLRCLLGSDGSLETTLHPAPALVLGEPVQMQRVLMNLTANARDAMPDGGRLLVATVNIEVGEDAPAEYAGATPGPYALLTVSDTGIGMDEEILARLWESYFTTKQRGRGTGLGLYIAYQLIRDLGGLMLVESALGKGTTFRILIPRIEDEEATDKAENHRQPQEAATILVVDDDKQVRAFLVDVLEDAGYAVLEATDGEEATRELECLLVDLVLMDIVMPDHDSLEAIHALHKRWPHLKVVGMSGEGGEDLLNLAISLGAADILAKPICPTILRATVARLLDR